MRGKQFCFQKELGRGRFGSVFMATRRNTGENLAIKVLESLNPKTASEEVAILKIIRHTYIIKYVESFYNKDGHLNIVLEFADLGTLENEVINQRVNNEEYCIWRFISQISDALKYLHTLKPRPVIHRDLKPANILGFKMWNTKLNENTITWKISNFGCAKLINKNSQNEYIARSTDGTPIYMAPEVIFPILHYT